MSRGPAPSRLCLLSSLPDREMGAKVRFLGCVNTYRALDGQLILRHLYPRDSTVTAVVNVDLILDTLSGDTTRVGEWVNVIGYITSHEQRRKQTKATDKNATGQRDVEVKVQGLVVWSTGPLDVKRYEATFETADV